ncbi:hypothetical protein NDN01_06675 [Sphingomonas sp. QA11]|uniref:hypothetical protein n=1 Tax=Sphingomonas sp. QA11 TaxID=2950605 RepID=UPI00234BE434|nr:hypothetical protein [Sphingomonas sp. QA11]WCM28602.1 hypothetical protein NDN01_06675 [Sphingomonas sp. QA11]
MMPAILFLRFRLGKMPAAPQPVDPVRAEKLVMRVMGTVGLGGALVRAGALLLAQHYPDRAGPSVDVDLATLGAAAPPLGRVTLSGTIDSDHVARKAIGAKGVGGRYLFAAMTMPGARHDSADFR